MPDPDYKALCAELLADYDNCHYRSELSDRARAALAQPEPVAPTLKEVSDWILLEKKKGARWATATDHYEALPIACASMHHALARWGNSQGILDSSLQREPASEEN